MENLIDEDKRTSSGYEKPAPPERYGKIEGFIPSRDRVLIKRLDSISSHGMIAAPDVAIEKASRGYVIAVGPCEYGAPPLGGIADFSKYGAHEQRFDDDNGPESYVTVWLHDIWGWRNA